MSYDPDGLAYIEYWTDVGKNFPSFKGAPSTDYYFECERMLCERFFPDLRGLRLLKSDLWDEAKNTEILLWAAGKGAATVGVDIAMNTVEQARAVFKMYQPAFAVGDVRALPFASNSVDLIYSMGTIEHFPEHEAAVRELYRVLKPEGTAIIGVPNKLDPFLRPLLVLMLNKFGLYSYGMEKSFAAGALRGLLTAAGFRVVGQSGILFMPGWLRMLDLFLYVRDPRWARLTRLLISPWAWLYRHFPSVRRHGYLIACAVIKPAA